MPAYIMSIPTGLRLDNSVAGALKTENEAGETTPISVHFPGFAITVESREQGPREEYAEFTRLYSREINEQALVGSIGAKILKNYRVTFDLNVGEIELELPAEARLPIPESQRTSSSSEALLGDEESWNRGRDAIDGRDSKVHRFMRIVDITR